MALPGAPAPSPVAAGPQAAAPLPPSPSSPPTVLMAVRAGLAEPSRLPSLPAASSLRLQLSVQPGTGGRRRFRLGLRGTEAPGGENLVEFNLSDISYRVRSPTCHELRVPTSPEDPVILNFEEEREAQKWWTILSSSLREAQKASETSPAPQASSPPPSSASDPHPEADPASELAEKEDLALQLCEAIECGDEDLAARSAVALARQQAPLRILWRESTYPPDSICMKVGVEDSTSSANITIQVQAHTTIEELKQQIFQDYGFHPLLQRWIIGQCLCVDDRTVASYGIRRDGDVAFLYLLSAKAAHLTRQRYEEDQARLLLGSVSSFSSDLGEQSRKYNTCPSRTSSKPAFGNEAGRRLDLAETNQALDSLQLRDLGSPPAAPDPPSPAQLGWSCPQCTFINKPTRPGCEMCSSHRPADYSVPGGHQPDESELWRMRQEQEETRKYHEALEAERQENLQQLLELEQEVLVATREPLECRICCRLVPPGQGVLLRECLHSFCRECLRQVINHSEEPLVACPFRDESYACGSHLQEREIRALVSPDEYRLFLERSLVLAERRSPNSFHCRTPDCRGWCFYEDSVNEFRCPICQALNCLLCKAIHEGQNCRQYQDDLQARAQDDAAARQTNAMLQTLVQRGDAMRCPGCAVVVQKRDGCDWLRCRLCQTEICWVTKGPRWGPAGPGDTSGGCRCNVSGQRCHPQCHNCH
ncbi:ranBP-type and C3HC4-type zinc finger-containing protein 1-like isoform X1 [Phaenicophaeus curvirostris]|uniref:ranBP-type and C3HC4-type zinc finger-containing protein 1-like isoform X1 n=1 Tax=Phaenicophaeus curvirostris TaxID=33595 RepID=UPI0037F0EF85